MTPAEWLLLLGAGFLAGVINALASGGSFFTYPALILTGLTPVSAAATTLTALAPANIVAIPEYLPEIRSDWHRYPRELAIIIAGATLGIGALIRTDNGFFERFVPWLILAGTLFYAASPWIRRWSERQAPEAATGLVGTVAMFVFAVYLTYFGSGVGNVFIGMYTIRGFDTFLSANAAKNIAIAIGTVMAVVAYSATGFVSWSALVPLAIGSLSGGWLSAKGGRRVPVRAIRVATIAFGLFVAGWLFVR